MNSSWKRQSHLSRVFQSNLLLILTIIGVIIGVLLGTGLNLGDFQLTARQQAYLAFPGEIFLRLLKLFILPLITSSLICSLAKLDPKIASKMSYFACFYYLITTGLAVLTGITLVLLIHPGGGNIPSISENASQMTCMGTIPSDAIMDLVRNLFPDNILEAGFQSTRTCVKFVRKTNTTISVMISYQDWEALTSDEQSVWNPSPYQSPKSGMNVLGLVVFSLFLGYIIQKMGNAGDSLREFFSALEAAIMRMVVIVIWLSPIGILFLITSQIAKMDNLLLELHRLALYMITVIIGLLVHAFVTLPVLLLILAKRNPLKYTYGMLQALLTAFGTSSRWNKEREAQGGHLSVDCTNCTDETFSSATIPITLECVEDNNKVDSKVSRFVIPLGATINMDGTALYEAVAAIYIAQSIGHSMNIGHVLIISLTATFASIGAAGIPQAGLVTMIMVLIAVGIDPKYFVLIIPVDWLLDRIRTTVNVHGDSYGAAIVERLTLFTGSDNCQDEHLSTLHKMQNSIIMGKFNETEMDKIDTEHVSTVVVA